MRITQWGEFAVHFCLHMAKEEELGRTTTNAAHLAASQNIDQLYAQQILQRLRKASIIDSVRGPQGGYKLCRTADKITLYDIIVAAEGDTLELMCDSKPIDLERCSPTSACGLRTVWQDFRDHVNSFLTSHSIRDILVRYPNIADAPIQIGGNTAKNIEASTS